MPANPKYLTQSKGQRFLKITAAILGGYLVSVSFHLALAAWTNKTAIVMTMSFSGFIPFIKYKWSNICILDYFFINSDYLIII